MFGVTHLVNPPTPEEELPEQRYWLMLADIALRLDEARQEQKRIKEKIRPSVEKYRRIRRKRKAA
jgi:hypothetical protein